MDNQLLNIVDLLADLKSKIPFEGARALLIGKAALGDGLGGFYRWDSASIATEELTYLNVVAANSIATGRWVRIFQKAQTYPQGTLVNIGGIKTLYGAGLTNASGQAAFNTTADGTATGTSLFSEIWDARSYSLATATGPSDAIQSYLMSQTMKVSTFGYYKANAVTITLGLAYAPLASIGTGTNVRFIITGI